MKPKILIIEKSVILRKGLVDIFIDNNILNDTIYQCGNKCNWLTAISKLEPQIIVCSPFFLEKNHAFFKSLKQKNNAQLIGLIYSFHKPNLLNEFDALIYLTDSENQISTTINKIISNRTSFENASLAENLSIRETEVLKWLANGFSNQQIADTLFISIHTVNNHRKNIARKLDIKTTAGLTVYAVLNNIISLDENVQ